MRTLFDRQHAHVVSSYRMGLFFTLKSLNLSLNDEVLLTPLTVADTINAIRLAGLKPILVDIDLRTHCICMEDLQKKLTNRSKVLLITYLSGIVPDIDQIKALANSRGLIMIEDISQNVGATFKEKKIGSHGEVSIASLSCGKNISTLYGGLILSNDGDLFGRIKTESEKQAVVAKKSILRYYLLNCIKVQIATSRPIFPLFVFPIIRALSAISNSYPVNFTHDAPVENNIFCSANPTVRLSFPEAFYTSVNDWQFSLMDHQLEKLAEGTRQRRLLAQALLDNLSAASLKFIPRGLMKVSDNSYYHFPIYCGAHKGKLSKHLLEHGVDNGSYGLNLCSEEKAFNLLVSLPKARKIKYETLFLPIHESYSTSQMKNTADAVNSFFENTQIKPAAVI